MVAIYVLITVHWSIVQQIGIGTGNIKVAEREHLRHHHPGWNNVRIVGM